MSQLNSNGWRQSIATIHFRFETVTRTRQITPRFSADILFNHDYNVIHMSERLCCSLRYAFNFEVLKVLQHCLLIHLLVMQDQAPLDALSSVQSIMND